MFMEHSLKRSQRIQIISYALTPLIRGTILPAKRVYDLFVVITFNSGVIAAYQTIVKFRSTYTLVTFPVVKKSIE